MYNNIMNYEPILNKLIKKVSHQFKSGEELEAALKAKLTKKEFKVLKNLASNEPKELLKLDEPEYKRVEQNLKKKLNQEKVKQAIYFI